MQFSPGLFTRELPVDGGAVVVDAALPSINFTAQYGKVTDSALSQTLAAKQAHFDLGLIQPTAMLGCVMHCEAIPQQAALAEMHTSAPASTVVRPSSICRNTKALITARTGCTPPLNNASTCFRSCREKSVI